MADVVLLTVGSLPAYGAAAVAAWEGAGLEVQVLPVAGRHLPLFDGRPLRQHSHPGAARLARSVDGARWLVLVGPATAGGCAGALINALQLIGGPAYDHPDAPPPLVGRGVGVIITGPPPDARGAMGQLAAMIPAMGGRLVAAVWADGPGAMPPADFARRFLTEGEPETVALPSVDMSLGDVRFPAPDAVRATAAAAAATVSTYTPSGGLPELRAELTAYLRSQGLPVGDPQQVVVTAGATAGLCACLLARLRPGDGVLLPDPGFPQYRRLATAFGLRPLTYRLNAARGHLPDPAELERLAPAARALIWNFPHNPLGSVAPPELVGHAVDLARHHDLTIISDEVYAGLTWEATVVSPAAAGAADRTCVIGSFSKIAAMAGYRVGWALVPPDLAAGVAAAHRTVAMSPALISQQAALAALPVLPGYLANLRAQLLENRRTASATLAEAGVPHHLPAAGYYLWLDISNTGLTGAAFAQRLWAEERVRVEPGEAFGDTADTCVRVSIALPREQVRDGLYRLGRLYRRLRGQ